VGKRYTPAEFDVAAAIYGYDTRDMAIYERLKAWERCHQLCVAVYNATDSWPKGERYGLVSQARRAAHSAAANIAEGCAKQGPREFRRYLDISLGSLSELSYTLLLARDLTILSHERWLELDEVHRKAGGMTWLLYKSLLAKTSTGPTRR
jgi:four helix bundle protein